MSSILPPNRTCTRCQQSFPATLEYFPPQKTGKYGLHAWCRLCVKAYQEQYRANHKSGKREYNHQYYYNHQDEILKKKRDYYSKTAERQREKSRQYRNTHPGRNAEYQRRYRSLYPDIVNKRIANWRKRGNGRIKWHRYYSKKKTLPYDFVLSDWHRALTYFNNRCAVCGRPLNGLFHKAAMDHWIPISSPECPGTLVTNIVPLCHGNNGCNNSKGDKLPLEWLKEKYSRRKAKIVLNRITTYFHWAEEQHESACFNQR
jgi:hypothetical protein